MNTKDPLIVPDGLRARYRHERVPQLLQDTARMDHQDRTITFQYIPSPVGGATICELVDRVTGEAVAMATSIVHEGEHYNKDIGRKVTLGRALKLLIWNTAEQIYEAYLKALPNYSDDHVLLVNLPEMEQHSYLAAARKVLFEADPDPSTKVVH